MEISVSLNSVGDGVEAVVLLPPGVSSAMDVVVEVLGDDTLLIQRPSCNHAVQVALPVAVDPDTGRVRFKRTTGKLTFTAAAKRGVPPTPALSGADSDPTGSRLACKTSPTDPDIVTSTVSSPPSPAQPPGPDLQLAAAPCPAAGIAQQPKPEPARPSPSNPSTDGAAPLQPGHPAGSSTGNATQTAGEALVATPAPTFPAICIAKPGDGGGSAVAAATSQAGIRDPGYCSAATTETSSVATGLPSDSSGGGGAAPAPAATATAPAVCFASAIDTDKGSVPSPPATSATKSTSRAATAAAATTMAIATDGYGRTDRDGDNDDVKLYQEFYCDSPPAMPPPPRPEPTANGRDAVHSTGTPTPAAFPDHGNNDGGGGGGGGDEGRGVNATRVAAAFEPTGGTSSRDAGFSFTAPELPPPPPLPAGLPTVAPPIDCRYLAVANALRVSAHSSTAALAELMGLRRRGSVAAERRKADKCNAILQRVADTLDAYGYAVLDNYISEGAIKGARAELKVMEPHYSPGMIWVGKEAETGAQIAVSSVRGDVVLWLDDQALNATAFVKDGVRRDCSFMQLQQMLADVDELVFEGLRPRLRYLAGLHRRSDAMMAVYPGKGARFAKHVDNTTMDGRRLTVLTYLNPDWQERQGGALRLFPMREGAVEVVDVLPVAGRVALFLSAEVAHEVMPSFGPRHAVTLWYFDAGEHAAALTAAKVMTGVSSQPAAQAAATALLRDLLADETASGIQATTEGCAELGTRVAALEPGAQQLLAAVLGLPSAMALVESMRNLTPESLRLRREELRNMGLMTQHHAPDTSAHV